MKTQRERRIGSPTAIVINGPDVSVGEPTSAAQYTLHHQYSNSQTRVLDRSSDDAVEEMEIDDRGGCRNRIVTGNAVKLNKLTGTNNFRFSPLSNFRKLNFIVFTVFLDVEIMRPAEPPCASPRPAL